MGLEGEQMPSSTNLTAKNKNSLIGARPNSLFAFETHSWRCFQVGSGILVHAPKMYNLSCSTPSLVVVRYQSQVGSGILVHAPKMSNLSCSTPSLVVVRYQCHLTLMNLHREYLNLK
jgi:hypothetical protein